MRIRFFALIAIAIFLNTIFITLVYVAYIRKERLQLIDAQIRESAVVLVDSELAALKRIDFVRADEIISDELGPNRIGKFFVIRNDHDEIVYESTSASVLDKEFPRQPQWVTVEEGKHFIRVLNLELPKRPDRTLQVGLVIDREFMGWTSFRKTILTYLAFASAGVILFSFVLTFFLLKPFRMLVHHIKNVVRQLSRLSDVEDIPESIARKSRHSWFRSDEFAQLIGALQLMIDRINGNNRLTKVWSARMAHEFKTPLSIIRARLESSLGSPLQKKEVILSEVESLSSIVSEFLSWAELETSPTKGNLHALKVGEFVRSVVRRLEPIGGTRVHVTIRSDFVTLIFPTHLDQLLTNLITNAFKFSPADKKIEIVVHDQAMQIIDLGAGIPPAVLERIGQPFNVGFSKKQNSRDNTGLGLAIANSIAKLYEIEMSYAKTEAGSAWTLHFPAI